MPFIGATQASTFTGTTGTTGTFVSDPVLSETSDYVTGTVFSSSAGSLYIEQSPDAVNWDPTTGAAVLNYTASGNTNAPIDVSANSSKGFNEQIIQAYWRIRFVRTSGAGSPATFKLSASTSDSGVKY